LITRIIFGDEYRSLNSSLCSLNFQFKCWLCTYWAPWSSRRLRYVTGLINRATQHNIPEDANPRLQRHEHLKIPTCVYYILQKPTPRNWLLLQTAILKLRMSGAMPPPSHKTSWPAQGKLISKNRLLSMLIVTLLVAKFSAFSKHIYSSPCIQQLCPWSTHHLYCCLFNVFSKKLN
jgi:hypothetical protein